MANFLTNLSINELSFVEAPANQDAKVAVLKGGAAVLSDAAHPVRTIVSKTAANPLLDRSPPHKQVVTMKATPAREPVAKFFEALVSEVGARSCSAPRRDVAGAPSRTGTVQELSR